MEFPSVPASSPITKRHEAYTALFKPEKLDDLLSVFSDDITYSDYSWNALNMRKEAHAQFYKYMFDMTSDLSFVTHLINGTEEFTAWEITVRLVPMEDDPAHNLTAGQLVELRGVSLLWWRKCEEGETGGLMGWKIFRGHDYARPP